MGKNQTRTAPLDIAEIERNLRYVFCAEPAARDVYNGDPADILDEETRTIVQAAFELRRRNLPATVEALAAMGCGDIETLRTYGRLVTRQMKEDWPLYSVLIGKAAQKRRLMIELDEQKQRLVTTPLLQLDDYTHQLTMRLADLTLCTDAHQLTEIGALLDDIMTGSATPLLSDPIPTGILPFDEALGGGIRCKQIGTIVGPEKGGKTTSLRNVGLTIAFGGDSFLHVAADGGDRRRHTICYLGMRTAYHCLTHNIPTMVHGYPMDALHWTNLAIWAANQNPRNPFKDLMTPLPPQIEELLNLAVTEFRDLQHRGLLEIVDLEILGFSPRRLVDYIRHAHYHKGVKVVGVDHVGKFGNKEKLAIYDRVAATVQMLIEIPNSLDMALLALSQMTTGGVKELTRDENDDTQNWSAETEGGRTLQQESDIVAQVKRKGNTLFYRTKLNRDGPSHEPWAEIPLHPGTGLFLSSVGGYSPVAGYEEQEPSCARRPDAMVRRKQLDAAVTPRRG